MIMIDPILETPSALFQQLQEAVRLSDVRNTYREFSRILRLAVNQKTQFNDLHLGSLYAKLDYLSREYQLNGKLMHDINDTRVRLRHLLRLSDAELSRALTTDLRAITLFIQAVYGEAAPSALVVLFPTESFTETKAEVVDIEYFRFYVSHFDNVYLYGHTDAVPDEEVQVCYCFKARTINGDWSHLRPFLHAELQLNVVHPRLFNGVFYPELLILEPDYLVDVTAITGCYEDFAHDARLHLLSLLSPAEDTEPIMLGNLAGMLLDEEVHSEGHAVAYNECYESFMRDNAFKVLTVKPKSLYEEGKKQQQNIHRSLHEGLASYVGQYRREEVMLEPSFISEMLGIQGRMDFLQLDYRVLLEQKAGKSEWPQPKHLDDVPRPIGKHYLQVLLYLAILNYNYGIPNNQVQALLLYSKYPKPLVGVAAAPEMLHEAFRLRNQLVGQSEQIILGDTPLAELTPDTFKPLGNRASFYAQFKRPQFAKVLDPIREASSLERCYFERFFRFLTLEHSLSKVGTQTKESSGFASKWHDTLDDKYQSGNIFDGLTLVSPTLSNHGPAVLRLSFAFDANRVSEMSNFRLGDLVLAYPYHIGEEPDCRRTLVFKASIESLGETIILLLRAPQSDPQVFVRYDLEHWCWAIEHDLMDSTFKSLFAGLHAFLTAPKDRRDLLLFQREPRVDQQCCLRGDYGQFNELALRIRQAQDFFLIIGPPGTGKTSYGMLYTLKEQLLEPNTNVLITSYTNRAVDEICSKLFEEGIDFIRLGSHTTCSPEYQPNLLQQRLAAVKGIEAMQRLLDGVRVIVSTTSSLSSNTKLFSLKHFDLIIIDEASQILEPHLLAILSACHCRFVMIGDHKQLPAVVQQSPEQSKVDEASLNGVGLSDCRLSLFERLLCRYRNNPQVVYMLTRQGRMHRAIADFPNLMFYGGKLDVVPLEHQVIQLPLIETKKPDIAQIVNSYRLAFFPVSSPSSVCDKVNVAEARLIASFARVIFRKYGRNFDPQHTLGVIVPYRNQISAIRKLLDDPILSSITIDTVERYQGSQRDYILYGFTIQHSYQLNFLANNTFEEDGMLIDRKLNVAMTRARCHLFMFGNPQLLERNAVFGALMDYCRRHQCYLNPPL